MVFRVSNMSVGHYITMQSLLEVDITSVCGILGELPCVVKSHERVIRCRDSAVTCFHGFGCSLSDRDWNAPSDASDQGPPGTEPEGDIEVNYGVVSYPDLPRPHGNE